MASSHSRQPKTQAADGGIEKQNRYDDYETAPTLSMRVRRHPRPLSPHDRYLAASAYRESATAYSCQHHLHPQSPQSLPVRPPTRLLAEPRPSQIAYIYQLPLSSSSLYICFIHLNRMHCLAHVVHPQNRRTLSQCLPTENLRTAQCLVRRDVEQACNH